MTKRILGINLSPGDIEIAEIVDGKLINSVVESIDKSLSEKDLGQKLSSLLKRNKIRPAPAIVSLFGTEVFFQLLELPVIPKNEIERAIGIKISGSIPFSAKEAIINYYKIDGSTRQLFFVSAVSKVTVDKIFKIFDAAKIRVLDILPASSSLATRFKKDDPAYAIISLGRSSAFIVLMKKGSVVFARNINIGKEVLIRSLVGVVATEGGRLEIDETKAIEIIDKFGIPLDLDDYSKKTNLPAPEIMSMMRPALEKLAAEILRTFEYYHQQAHDETEFSKIYFTGNESKTVNLLEYFKTVFDQEINLLPVFSKGANLSYDGALSLLPDEKRHPILTLIPKVLNLWFLLFVTLSLMFVVVFNYSIYGNRLQKDLSRLQHEIRLKGINVEKPSAAEDVVSNLIKEFGPEDNFIDLLNKMGSIIPEDVYFESIDYNKKSRALQMNGIVLKSSKDSAISLFIKKLNETKYFSSIDLASFDEVDKYTIPVYMFTIKAVFYGEKR